MGHGSRKPLFIQQEILSHFNIASCFGPEISSHPYLWSIISNVSTFKPNVVWGPVILVLLSPSEGCRNVWRPVTSFSVFFLATYLFRAVIKYQLNFEIPHKQLGLEISSHLEYPRAVCSAPSVYIDHSWLQSQGRTTILLSVLSVSRPSNFTQSIIFVF